MVTGRLGVWPSLHAASFVRPRRRLPFPLDDPACRLVPRARVGLWQAVRRLGVGPGDEVLVPAYHHGSEVEALLRAGAVCRFYDATDSLEPDPDELEALLGPRTRALHLTHVLGFPRAAERWRRWCDERGLLLLEDAAQAWLAGEPGRPVGSWGAVAIFCLYKTVPLPSGAAVLVAGHEDRPAANDPLAVADAGRWLAGQAMRRSGRLADVLDRRHPPFDPASDIDLGDVDAPWPGSLRRLLPFVADPDAAGGRRRNYARLLDRLGERVPAPFDRLPADASPFAFPVMTGGHEHKARVLEELTAAGIDAIDFWSLPHPALPVDAFPGAARRRADVVALPVHQGLRPAAVDRVAAAAERALSRRA